MTNTGRVICGLLVQEAAPRAKRGFDVETVWRFEDVCVDFNLVKSREMFVSSKLKEEEDEDG